MTAPPLPAAAGASAREVPVAPGRARRTWRLLRAHPLALAGSAALAVLAALALLAPWIAPYPPDAIDLRGIAAPPSPAHAFGTDELGRDELSRLLYGGRVSLLVGAGSTAIAVAIGATVGALAGFRGGRVDAVLMRGVDLLLSLPAIFVLLILTSVHRGSALDLVLYIGLFGWMGMARLVRGQMLSLREREFVAAARSLGASGTRIVLHHLVPHAAPPLIVAATLGVGSAMLLEAAVDFLGFGISADTPTWGSLLYNAELYLTTEPLLAIAPGLLIAIAVMSVNLVGGALRDALDPHGAGAAR